MRLIIDAGSTKMEWILLDGNTVKQRFYTEGFNPNYAEKQCLVDMCHGVSLPDGIHYIHYYGTGCGNEQNCLLIKEVFQERFPFAEIHVTHDLMAACHAVLGHEKGIVYYAESLATIANDMREIHPTMMCAVPRVLERFYDAIYQSGKKQKGIARAIFFWALHLGERYKIDSVNRHWFYDWKLSIADKLVYSKIRSNIGAENFDIIVSGAAAISQKIAGFFSAIKMPVFEGYGLTETSPVIAVSNRNPHGREVGYVGQPLPGTEVKIADNGEICCRGHNVMMGYYKHPELTKEVIDEEGWFQWS